MLTLEKAHENPIAKKLLQMLSIGDEMESSQKRIRQNEGIKFARIKGIYTGRRIGAKTTHDNLLTKYKKVSDLIDKSDLSIRRIAGITNHSVNTVWKIKQLKEL